MLAAALLVPVPGLLAASMSSTENYFQHGVASGDPLQDRVIIWTRVTAMAYLDKEVKWELASDPQFLTIVSKGTKQIAKHSDYTVKVDVKGLKAGTKYYYRFFYQNAVSGIGFTKTLAKELNDGNFTMAVVSCNNWEDGYFNSFRFLAQKQEVDLVLHLGDYIYEYATGEYGNPQSGRINEPRHELLTLQDYRTRYAQYRTDADLQALHAQKPFYLIWDDHELANDAYVDGAKNHQPNEGPWLKRKKAAIQAYLEWMPIRAKNAAQVRRKFDIGDDISLYLMDERSTGRTQQLEATDPHFEDQNRAIIGQEQFNWLAKELQNSKATWKLIGNQVMFAGYAVAQGFKLPKYNDWWLGYPYERAKLMALLAEKQIDNPIFLTGDHHESFVLALHQEEKLLSYTKPYQQKPLAWELLTPSITSKNADRRSKAENEEFEKMLSNPAINPHMAFGDIKNHGYFIATISKQFFKADYFFVDHILTKTAKEYKASSFLINADTFKLTVNSNNE